MPAIRRRATQIDVARVVGVSVMTVSLALRNRPGVAPATAARVRAVAEQLGYRPDPALSALVHYRQARRTKRIEAAIALLSAWGSPREWLETKVGKLAFEGARQRAEGYGYRLEPFWLGRHGEQSRRVGDILISRGIRGIVLAPLLTGWQELRIDWSRFATVTLERSPDFPPVPHVSPNHFADLMLAWKHLTALGYKRIGFAVFEWLGERGQHRWEAAHLIQQRLLARAADRIPHLVVPAGKALSEPRVDAWMRRHRPDVVVSPSPEFRQALLATGWRIPQDVAYASLQIQLDNPRVSGINQHRDLMGAVCIDMLHAQLQRGEFGIPSVLAGTTIDGEWVDGETTVKKA